MKKIILISILMLAFLVSCEKDEYDTPYGDFSSFQWFTSTDNQDANYVIALDNYIAFSDVSQNALTHSWKIPSGTNLLNEEFNATQDTIYTDFISSGGPSASSKKLINVIFRQPGVKEVELRNTFKDSVAESTLSNGVWVVNKIFTVTVFDDIKPAFKVMRGTEEILTISETDMPSVADAASWPTVTLEAGETLTYVNMTTIGDPDTGTWEFNGASPSNSNAPTVNASYNSLGNYTGGSVTVKRTDAAKPDGEATKIIPLKIVVIPSTQPFVINGNINEDALEVISFNVTGEIQSVTGEEANFTVNVMNSASGFNQNIMVESVAVNSSDATQIDLTLSAPIYNSDVITVTYVAGNIQSVDTRVLESFGPETVELYFEGAMNIPGFTGYEVPWDGVSNQFKSANTDGYFAQHNGNSEAGPLYYWRDTEMVFEGNSSMKFETPATGIPNNARLQGSDFSVLSPVTAGTYIPSVWIYIEAGNTMNNLQYNFQSDTDFVFDISTTPRGEWINLTLPEVTLGDINSGRFDINIRKAGQDDAIVQKLWLDNFDLIIVEPRL